MGFLTAWTCREGPQQYGAVQIDAGWGQVVMRDRNNQVYFLSGSAWYALGTVRLKHVSVGPAGIWGADASDRVYKYVAGNFVVSEGNYPYTTDSHPHLQYGAQLLLHANKMTK